MFNANFANCRQLYFGQATESIHENSRNWHLISAFPLKTVHDKTFSEGCVKAKDHFTKPVLHFGLHLIAPALFPDYSRPMKNKKHFFKTNKAGFVLGAVLLTALTECVGSADGQGVGITVTPPAVVVAPPVVAPVVVIEDDYVYYPNYAIYYNSRRHQYAYLENGVWVSQPAPQGVSAEVLLASPSVNMDWHDSPERHHAEMLQRYPKNWKPSGGHQDQKEDRKVAAPDGDKKMPGQTAMPPH